jgi:hypothetical protein
MLVGIVTLTHHVLALSGTSARITAKEATCKIRLMRFAKFVEHLESKLPFSEPETCIDGLSYDAIHSGMCT